MALLKIGAVLNAPQELEALQIHLLEQILEVVPADQAAIVLLAQGAGGEPSVLGWDRRHNQAAAVPVSRTLVTKAINGSLATFSDDVTSQEELSEVTSLVRRRVVSVITVPLVAKQRTIGAIYLDSANPMDRLHREHFEIATAIGEFAGSSLEQAVYLSALKDIPGREPTAPLPFGTRDSEGEAHSTPDVGHGENTHQCGPTEAVGKPTRRRKEPKEAYWIAASVARFLPIIRIPCPSIPRI